MGRGRRDMAKDDSGGRQPEESQRPPSGKRDSGARSSNANVDKADETTTGEKTGSKFVIHRAANAFRAVSDAAKSTRNLVSDKLRRMSSADSDDELGFTSHRSRSGSKAESDSTAGGEASRMRSISPSSLRCHKCGHDTGRGAAKMFCTECKNAFCDKCPFYSFRQQSASAKSNNKLGTCSACFDSKLNGSPQRKHCLPDHGLGTALTRPKESQTSGSSETPHAQTSVPMRRQGAASVRPARKPASAASEFEYLDLDDVSINETPPPKKTQQSNLPRTAKSNCNDLSLEDVLAELNDIIPIANRSFELNPVDSSALCCISDSPTGSSPSETSCRRQGASESVMFSPDDETDRTHVLNAFSYAARTPPPKSGSQDDECEQNCENNCSADVAVSEAIDSTHQFQQIQWTANDMSWESATSAEVSSVSSSANKNSAHSLVACCMQPPPAEEVPAEENRSKAGVPKDEENDCMGGTADIVTDFQPSEVETTTCREAKCDDDIKIAKKLESPNSPASNVEVVEDKSKFTDCETNATETCGGEDVFESVHTSTGENIAAVDRTPCRYQPKASFVSPPWSDSYVGSTKSSRSGSGRRRNPALSSPAMHSLEYSGSSGLSSHWGKDTDPREMGRTPIAPATSMQSPTVFSNVEVDTEMSTDRSSPKGTSGSRKNAAVVTSPLQLKNISPNNSPLWMSEFKTLEVAPSLEHVQVIVKTPKVEKHPDSSFTQRIARYLCGAAMLLGAALMVLLIAEITVVYTGEHIFKSVCSNNPSYCQNSYWHFDFESKGGQLCDVHDPNNYCHPSHSAAADSARATKEYYAVVPSKVTLVALPLVDISQSRWRQGTGIPGRVGFALWTSFKNAMTQDVYID